MSGTAPPGTTVIQVSSELELNQAIADADTFASGTCEIVFEASITEGQDTGQSVTYDDQTLLAPADLYAIALRPGVSLTIDGNGYSLSGDNAYRGLLAYTGAIAITELTIMDAVASGGAGAVGGGGGAGLGGGLFVASGASVTLTKVTFSNDAAQGGAGGSAPAYAGSSGGGGGLGGAGAAAGTDGTGSGGGGIGAGAFGGVDPGAGTALNQASSGREDRGAPFGGGGVSNDATNGSGGGIGRSGIGPLNAGGFGGGGGPGGTGGFGGGGGSGPTGGAGGFGGGGGASFAVGKSAGAGGFGGGSGAAATVGGSAQALGGGGGLGAGGDIFVAQGGNLVLAGGALAGGQVAAGAGAGAGSAGMAYGAGVFFQGDNVVTLAPAAGDTLTIDNGIDDESGVSAFGTGGVAVQVDGPGRVVLAGSNAFSDPITLSGGVLELADGYANSGDPDVAITGPGTLQLDDAALLDQVVITNLGTAGSVDLAFLPYAAGQTPVVVDGGAGLQIGADGPVISGSFYEGATYAATSDGSGGTRIALSDTTVYQVGSALELNQDLLTLALSPTAGTTVIQLTANIEEGDGGGAFLTAPDGQSVLAPPGLFGISFLAPDPSLTIDGSNPAGGNYDISGDGQYRGLLVYAGAVTLQDLTIQNALAQGGAGGAGKGGGGGGAGLGGGLFVGAAAQVTLSNVTMQNDAAWGGAGGAPFAVTNVASGGGGGGGLGGNGGAGGDEQISGNAGGGGGGGVGVGAVGGAVTENGDPGLLPGQQAAGNTLFSGGGLSGGGGGGGGGGGRGGFNLTGTSGGGGGGVAGAPSDLIYAGNGGFGGGGGGGGAKIVFSAPPYDFPGVGGSGGFGGGGGAGGSGGHGGFGGGGGAGVSVNQPGGPKTGAVGGFGGGNGGMQQSAGSGGGGGLGAGGDIFIQSGGLLTIEGGNLLTGGSVKAGPGGLAADAENDGAAGQAYGAGIFLQGTGGTLTFAPPAGETTTIMDPITDEDGSADSTADGGYSVTMDGAGTLVLDAANTFTGGIVLADGTLELGVPGAAGSGEISFDVTPGALPAPLLKIDGSVLPQNLISGFADGAAINLAGIPLADVTGFHVGSSSITFTLIGAPFATTLQFANTLGTVQEGRASDGSLLIQTIACYCRGTRILTPAGEVAIEHLRQGDLVLTAADGGRVARPIRWIGCRRIDIAAHAQPDLVRSIRIRRGAVADNVPHRDLLVSPDHAILVDGLLMPARLLVNATTIAADPEQATAYYFHLELDRHCLLFAEGLEAETYLDTGNRHAFENGGLPVTLHPDFSTWSSPDADRSAACAPLATSANETEPAWRRLAVRAVALGYPAFRPVTASDPALRLSGAGRDIRPTEIVDGRYVFVLPKGTTAVRASSRAGSPSAIRPWLDDRRRLGVAVCRIILCDGRSVTDMPVDHPALADGWHDVESSEERLWRWTDGSAHVPIPAGTRSIEVHLHGGIDYEILTPPARPDELAA